MAKPGYQWVVVPQSSFINEVIARELSDTCEIPGNEIIFIDNKGEERKGYMVEYSFISMLSKQSKPGTDFRAFVRFRNGAYREWTFLKKKKAGKKS